MVANIIVAVACNLIAVLILLSGIFTAKSNGLIVTLVKFFIAVGGLVGAYFLTPVLSDLICGVDKVPELISYVGASMGSINSCIFLLVFMVFYGIDAIICSIVKHSLIKKMQGKKINQAKVKRAKSINPRAERLARKAEWKKAKQAYRASNRWYKRLISHLLALILSVTVGIVVLMPFGFIGRDISTVSTDKTYLVDGFEYTLNGVIPDSVFDWTTHTNK